MRLLGHKTIGTHTAIARTLAGSIATLLDRSDRLSKPVNVDDIALCAKGAIGDLAQVWAAATIGRDIATGEGVMLTLAVERAVWKIITEQEWADATARNIEHVTSLEPISEDDFDRLIHGS